jgi:RNA polymerase sigma factor (sigma-70 family)
MAPRFEDLLDRYHDGIFSYLWRPLGKARRSDVTLDVEDLVQEAFPGLRENSNHRAWLDKIAINCAFTGLRRVKSRRDKIVAVNPFNTAHDGRAAPESMRSPLVVAVNELSPEQMACITLRYFDDLDYSDIAAIVGCSEVSARANVSQAIRRLRNALRE